MPVFLVFAEDDHDLVGINKCSSQRATRVRLQHKHFFAVFFCFQMYSIFSNNENYKERRDFSTFYRSDIYATWLSLGKRHMLRKTRCILVFSLHGASLEKAQELKTMLRLTEKCKHVEQKGTPLAASE